MMATTDLALRLDPAYEQISRRFMENLTSSRTRSPRPGTSCFTATWDLSRYRGPWVPEPRLWQDPVPAVDHDLVGDQDIADLKEKPGSGLSISQLGLHRVGVGGQLPGTDMRGGANGARIRLAPQRDWEVNDPAELGTVLQTLEQIQQEFNGSQSGGKKISLADLIVLGGSAAVERAARNAGHDVTVPFVPGRTDASQEQTDVEAFRVLEPTADGFRNYLRPGEKLPAEARLLDRANLLTLTAPELTVLIGGMRALNANSGRSPHGVFTDRPETLTNDFFVNLLDGARSGRPPRRLRTCSRVGIAARARSGGPPPPSTSSSVPTLCSERSRRSTRPTTRGEVRPRLRAGVGQGDEPRPVRPGLIPTSRSAARRPAWTSSGTVGARRWARP